MFPLLMKTERKDEERAKKEDQESLKKEAEDRKTPETK